MVAGDRSFHSSCLSLTFSPRWLLALPCLCFVLDLPLARAGDLPVLSEFMADNRSTLKDEDERVVLSVQEGGLPPLGYHWRKDGKFLSGENKAALVLPSASLNDSGTYTVLVKYLTSAGFVTV